MSATIAPPSTSKGARQNTVDVRGLRIRIRIEGAGEPLLLLNGSARPLESWAAFSRAVTGRTIISYDAPGVGASSLPMIPLSMAGLADIASAVMDYAGFEAADVVGYSHGGAVAQQLAVDVPERVRSLVLAAASCGLGAVPAEPRTLGRTLTSPHPWSAPSPLGVLWQGLAVLTWSSIPTLGQITAPILVVCGKHDRIVPPANSALLARRIPGAQFATIEAGHDLQSGAPALAFGTLVGEFLNPKVP